MNLNDELVSVVMSTYNGSLYVAEQIESIINQTYSNLEIILADDASTDNTFDILNLMLKKVYDFTLKIKDERR